MSVQSTIVQLLVWFSVNYGVDGSYMDSSSNLARFDKTSPMPSSANADSVATDGLSPSSATTSAPVTSAAIDGYVDSKWPIEAKSDDQFEGRGRKKKYKKYELMLLTKMLVGLKVALLGVVLPLSIIAAKILSWKAVTLSLLAYMLAKIVFVKNLFMSKPSTQQPPPSTPTPTPVAPVAPIIIHSSGPAHDSVWKRQHHPRIHLQPEVHVHQSGGGGGAEEHGHTPSWTWAEESRDSKDPHELAFARVAREAGGRAAGPAGQDVAWPLAAWGPVGAPSGGL